MAAKSRKEIGCIGKGINVVQETREVKGEEVKRSVKEEAKKRAGGGLGPESGRAAEAG